MWALFQINLPFKVDWKLHKQAAFIQKCGVNTVDMCHTMCGTVWAQRQISTFVCLTLYLSCRSLYPTKNTRTVSSRWRKWRWCELVFHMAHTRVFTEWETKTWHVASLICYMPVSRARYWLVIFYWSDVRFNLLMKVNLIVWAPAPASWSS